MPKKAKLDKKQRQAKKMNSPQTRGKNAAGQTNGQFEMTLKERGRSQSEQAGGAPRQTY